MKSVEGVNWDEAGIIATDKTEDAFVARHMKDAGTYKDFSEEKKKNTLKLVWSLINPAPEVKKEK